MFELILLTALMGQCEAAGCDVAVAVKVEATAEAKARPAPVRKAVSVIRKRKVVRTRIARLREARPVRRGLGRLGRRVRR